MSDIKISVSLSSETQELLYDLLCAIHKLNESISPVTLEPGTLTATAETVPDPIPDNGVTQYSEPSSAEETPQKTDSQPTHNIEELRQLVVKVSAAGKKDEVKDIIRKYGKKVSDIHYTQIDTVYGEVEALL